MGLKVDIKKTLGNFDLEVILNTESGITGLLGPSGCGKSHTLKCIAGIEKPDSGYIELNGRVLFDSKNSINLTPQERRVGYLFQNYALFPNMNVAQNILVSMSKEIDFSEKQKELKEILALLDLENVKNHYPKALSDGQAQRCALARILVNKPEMLLLDEPFSALDAHLRDSIKIEIRDLIRDYDKDTIFVTHDRNEAYDMCDDIGILNDGKLVTKGKTKDIFANPKTIQAAIITGCKNIVSAKKASDYSVYISDWDITLETKEKVKDDIRAIGIRAHYFCEKTPENQFEVRLVNEMEEPFETILQFKYLNQKESTAPVWWRIPKDRKGESFSKSIGVRSENVLLLYDN